jgi:ribosomal-protein-alanine N-acetyltransferase
MRLVDVPQAIEIDRECFPTQWPTPPYRNDLLSNRLAHYLVAYEKDNHITSIEEMEQHETGINRFLGGVRHLIYPKGAPRSNQRIIGVTGFWLMAGEAHIITMGVRPSYQRQGVGELLLISTIDLAMTQHAEVMTLEVRISNSAAQALYQKHGFKKTGVRKSYYDDNYEDAVIMTTDMLTSDSFKSQFQMLKQSHIEKMIAI